MISRAYGTEYRSLKSLAEAKSFPDGVVILEGDYGGQIYVTCPASRIRCNEDTLQQLLTDLDHIAWPGNDDDSRHIYYERIPLGGGVAGGMDGGIVTDDVWIHDEFVKLGLVPAIREIILGDRISLRDM